jgi:Putative prokaryotic signal transducing protein
MPERDPNDVVRLATAPNPAQAHILEQALADEGIQAKVVGDYLDAGFGDVPGAMAEVWVHRHDLRKAQEILKRSSLGGAAPTPDENEADE